MLIWIKNISDRTFRKTMSKVKKESVLKMKKYEEKLVIIEERGSYSKTDKDTTFMRMKEEALNNDQTSLYTMFRLQQRIRSLRTTTYTEKLLI